MVTSGQWRGVSLGQSNGRQCDSYTSLVLLPENALLASTSGIVSAAAKARRVMKRPAGHNLQSILSIESILCLCGRLSPSKVSLAIN